MRGEEMAAVAGAGPCPPVGGVRATVSRVREAALSLAEAILHLREVRRATLNLIAPKAGDEDGDAAADCGDAARLLLSVRLLTLHAAELGKLREYERKATSRVMRATNRLDYVNAIRPVPVIDGLLAATAKVHGLTLVTRNEADVAGLGAAVLKPFTSILSGTFTRWAFAFDLPSE